MVQPNLEPPGGGNGVCCWMLQALRDDYQLGVFSWRTSDLSVSNEHYGTSLRPSELLQLSYPPLLGRFMDALPGTLSLLKTFALLKRSRVIQPCFDLVMSVNNEADFGRRGIQYIHYPWNYFPRPSVDQRWYSNRHTNLLYYRLLPHLADYSRERMTRNITLVNSDWIGEKMKTLYPNARTRTLYPPVLGEYPDVPWEDRHNGFVCVGRISPEKEIEKIVRILQAVREAGFPIHLHVVGPRDSGTYYAQIRELAQRNADWIEMNESLPREALNHLVAAHRYGIHGMPEEHFGMAIAEMLQAGCIPFIPNGGGQVEIVKRHEPLLYLSEEEAIRKISTVLRSPAEQTRLRTTLAPMRYRFSTERFIGEVREIVSDFFRAGTP